MTPTFLLRLADALTLSRLPLGLLFWWVAERPAWAITVLLVGAFTDVIDGPIARWARRRGNLISDRPPRGSWLDPLCDKFFVLSVLVATGYFKEVSPVVILAIAAREVVLVPLALLYRFTPGLRARLRYDFTAGVSGKAATAVQVLAIVAVLTAHPWAEPLAWLAAVVGLLAAGHYISRGVLQAALALGWLAAPLTTQRKE